MRETAEQLLLLAYGDAKQYEIDRLEDDLLGVSEELQEFLGVVAANCFMKED